MGPEAAVGGGFYDRPGVFERYVGRRGAGVCSPNHVMEEPAFTDAVGDVAGRRVLDLGCGEAGLGRSVLAAGCRSYVGVDGSAHMVESARRAVGGLGGSIELGDISRFTASPGSFDLVVSRLALHYLPEIASLFDSCREWLAPGGRLVVTVMHPVITSHDARGNARDQRTDWLVDGYFDRGGRRQRWLGDSVLWFHRTVEDYVQALLDAGFTLVGLRECEPRPNLLAGHEAELLRRRRIPLFLLLSACSPG